MSNNFWMKLFFTTLLTLLVALWLSGVASLDWFFAALFVAAVTYMCGGDDYA